MSAYGGSMRAKTPSEPRPDAMAKEPSTKLYVTNIHEHVSNADLKRHFAYAGCLQRCALHFGPKGESLGTAEVVFSTLDDALAAVDFYNNSELQGQKLKIEMIVSPEQFGHGRGGHGRGSGRAAQEVHAEVEIKPEEPRGCFEW